MDACISKSKPVVMVVAGQPDVTATLAEDSILRSELPVYRRDNMLVRPTAREAQASRGRTVTVGTLQQIDVTCAIDLMSKSASFVKFDKRSEGWVPCDPPRLAAEILLSRKGEWSFPRIAGVVTAPTLRPDGTVLDTPGYDMATRLFYIPDRSLKMPALPENPGKPDAEKALKLIVNLLAEFPFVAPLDRAVALSAIMTAVVRGAMMVAPLHAFRAPNPGTGKSYLADTVSAIATGRACPVISVSEKADETEKRLNGALLKGFPIIALDNVNGELGSDLLCQAVERPLLQLRPLGTSEMPEVENTATILATGNNLVVRDDLVRRTLLCSLDAGMERPEMREFKGDPVAMVQASRGVFVAACLTISRAYLAAGCPGELPALASFGDWSRLVRSPLVWLGCEDPAKSIEIARAEDPVANEAREVFDAWAECLGTHAAYTVSEIVERAEARVVDENYGHGGVEYRHPTLRTALLSLSRSHGIDRDSIGKWLRSRKNRIIAGYRLRAESDPKGKKPAKWSIHPT